MHAARDAARLARDVLGLFKLRIGVMIMITALVGLAVTPGAGARRRPGRWCSRSSVLVASASAGAFNQYVEDDTDRLMARTRGRAFVTGALPHTPAWLAADRRPARRRGRGGVVRAQCASPRCTSSSARSSTPWSTRSGSSAAPGSTSSSAGWPAASRCWPARRRSNPALGRAAAAAGAGAVPVDAAALLEPGDRQPAPTTPPPACRCCRWWSAPQRAARIVFAQHRGAGRGFAAAGASSAPGLIYFVGAAGRRRRLPAQGLAAGARAEPQDGDGVVLRVAGAIEPVALAAMADRCYRR